MAEVNARAFLNNVSLGIYGEAVRSPAYRDAKVRTLLATAAAVMGPSTEAPELRLVDDLGREYRDLAVVLVSNNPYALDRPLVTGTRPALDTGQLGIVALHAPGGSPHAPGRAWSAPRLEVNAPAAVHAGVDGEAVDLSPPLRFAIRPGALRVRISSRHPGASPSARPPRPPRPRRAAAKPADLSPRRIPSVFRWDMVRTGRPDRCGARSKRLRVLRLRQELPDGDYIRAAAATNRIGFLTLSDELGIGRDNHDRYTGLSASAPLPPRWFRDQAVVQPRDGGRGRRCIHAGGAVRLCGQAAR